MCFNVFKSTVLLFVLALISCGNTSKNNKQVTTNNKAVMASNSPLPAINNQEKIVLGANQTETYLPLLKNKQVGIVANQTSVIFKVSTHSYTHLVDSLYTLGVNIKTVFAPEHGFRGTADAGEHIKDGIDKKTGIPIISLYGNNKKPKSEQLKNVDIMVFDIQDIGARFYTYISTLHYVMEACAENRIPLIVLDRPNPNGFYIDGPVLEPEHKSFVGMHPIPVVHGMTIAEYAQMINGEQWLNNGIHCELTIVSLQNYTHNTPYSLPIKPSPNLPNDKAINLYPSLCFFEGTNVNAGRGTNKQFQVFGAPNLNYNVFTYKYIPKPNNGAKHPKNENMQCYGEDLSQTPSLNSLNLTWLIKAYNNTKDKSSFFNDFFTKLAGTKKLQLQIEMGVSEQDIKASWQNDLELFKTIRAKYLIYQ